MGWGKKKIRIAVALTSLFAAIRTRRSIWQQSAGVWWKKVLLEVDRRWTPGSYVALPLSAIYTYVLYFVLLVLEVILR